MREKFGEANFTLAITNLLLAQIKTNYPELKSSQAILGRIGVDTQRWIPKTNSPAVYFDRIKLISVGRLHPSKGHDVLLRSLKIITDAGRQVSLEIVGSGPERNSLVKLVAELSLESSVNFSGSQSEETVMSSISQADIFVLPSHAEPLGVVCMEAMALGIPVIATNSGGVSEIIKDGEDGILIPPMQPQALADAILELMSDEARRKQLGRAGRKTIEQSFDSRIGAETLFRRLFDED